MASIVHNFSVVAGSLGPVSFTSTGTLGINIGTVAGASATTEYDISIDVSQLNSIFLYSDGDLTLKTNSSSVPDQTITIKSGVPFFWTKDMGITNPLTTDVTKFYFVNAGAVDVNVNGLVNLTPV